MKKLMLMGGLVGFVIGMVFGFIQGVTWPSLFLRATIAMFIAGILLRWWGRIWVRSVRESCAGRLAAEIRQPQRGTLRKH